MKTLLNSLTLAAIAFASASILNAGDDNDETDGRGLGSVHRVNFAHVASAPPVGSTGPITPLISYHGGALVATPVVYVIWYGNWNASNGSDTPAGQQIVRDFLNSIGGSPYFAINKTYSTNAYTITGNVTFGGEYADSGSVGLNLSDSSIQLIVRNALSGGHLPYDANGVYFVLTSSANVKKSGFCTSYCGWHTAGSSTKGHIRYGFIGNANKCLSACAIQSTGPNGNAGVDGMISVIAHELEETTTDADPSSGYVDSAGAENGDKCAWTFGTTQVLPSGAYYNVTLGARNYLIQRNLVRASDGNNYCVMQ
jgi:Phosphate-induced protein 1 conserved region